jgi:UDP-3-O-[3-hydroxymyristoyl] N-acetylglucosamine deacetylase
LDRQRTIKGSIKVEGKGLHTGCYTKMYLHSAPENTGILFIKNKVKIPASYKFVVETSRRVVLEKDGEKISTVEHFLSSLYYLGISNLYVEVDGDELPILDGSALNWVEILENLVKDQDLLQDELTIETPYSFRDRNAEIIFFPSSKFQVLCAISFPNSFLKWQRFYLKDLKDYKTEIAPARTFGFYYEVEELIKRGLISGADLNNALLVGEEAYVNEPRFKDEPVRHKILDLIGDMALSGKRLKLKVISIGSGHSLHIKAISYLLRG